MTLQRRHIGIVGVAFGVLAVAACGSTSSGTGTATSAPAGSAAASPAGKALKDIKIAAVVKGLDNPFFGTISDGVKAAAQEYGVSATIEAAPGLNDETGQANKLDALAGQSFDCFVVIPISSNNLTQGLAKISAKGTPIVNIDSPVDPAGMQAAGGKINAFIGTDNTAAGKSGGEAMMKLIPAGKKVGLIAGLAGNVTSNERIDGFKSGATGASLLGPINADWDTTKALDAAKQMLAKDPDIAAFFAANDQMAQGIAKAVAESKKDIKVMGVDGIKDILAQIKSGEVTGSVSQYPYVMGRLGVEACIVAAQGGQVPEKVESPHVVITKENVDQAITDFPKPPGNTYDNPFATLIKK